MNPIAGSFQPSVKRAAAAMTDHKMPNNTRSLATDDHTYEDSVTVDNAVEQLRRAMVDELCTLQCEIEILRKGGWKVAIGPFLQQTEITDSEREHRHQSIDERTGCIVRKSNLPKAPANNSINKPALNGAVSSNGISKPALKTEICPWMPPYIRDLKPLLGSNLPTATNMISFSLDFLQRIFQGATEHSPGLWYIPLSVGEPLISGRTFYAIDGTNEPYLPSAPCSHGAKMTAFYNNDSHSDGGDTAYENVPLFISASAWAKNGKPHEYVYFGNYSQSRWSDKLGYSDMHDRVPQHVKEFWAAQLADPARPEWVTKALMKHFYPMPEYEGAMPNTAPNGSAVPEDDEKLQRKIQKSVKQHIQELQTWESHAKNMVGLMKKDAMLKAFDQSDADEHPGLRLWWEYLECTGWESSFYEMLVNEQAKSGLRRR